MNAVVKFTPAVKPEVPKVHELDLNDGFYYGQIRGFRDVVFNKMGRKAFVFLGGDRRPGVDIMEIELVGRGLPDTIQAVPVVLDEISVHEITQR